MFRLRGLAAKSKGWLRAPKVIWRADTTERSVTIEVRQWLPLPVLLILVGWYIAAPSITVAISLATTLAMLAASFLWVRGMARDVLGRRVLQYVAMQVGDELEEQVSLLNRARIPVLWAEFIDRSNIPFYTLTSVRAAGMESKLSWRVHTICTRRGVYNLGPWEMCTGDPFNLFLVRQVYLNKQEILVYPPLAVLPEELLPHRGATGDHRPLNQPLAAETADGMTVREYQQGDPLHHIHWRTTARKEQPFVKVFEPEAASRIWVVPDMDAAVQLGEGNDSTEETAILLAASLAARLLRDKLSVGVFAGGENPLVVLPQRGQAHLWKLLELLAPLHADAAWPLERSLEQIGRLVTSRDLLMVITPSCRTEWTQALQRMMHGRGGMSAEVLLLEPQSFGGQEDGASFLPGIVQAGIQARLVRRGDVKALTGVYGELSRWEFTTLGTGRAVLRQAPRRAAALFAGQAGMSGQSLVERAE
jgi:uncharacterized protein (DUF58 family)